MSISWRDAGILATSMFGIAAGCLTLGNYVVGAFVYPLGAAFGWPRRDIMLAYSVLTLVTMAMSFVAGALVDRASPRRLIIASQIAFGLSFMLLAALTNGDIVRFYLLHAVMAIAAAGCLPVAFNAIVAAHFTRHRGLALGIMLTGSGLCGVVIPPYLTLLIGHFGWRAAYVGLGLVPIAGAMLLSIPLLPRDQSAGGRTLAEAARFGVTLGQATRDRRLWTIAASLLIGSSLSTAIVANFVPMLRDQHVDPLAAAGALSLFGLAVIAGRLLVGMLVDRFWAPAVALIVMIPASAALFALSALPIGPRSAMLCAIGLGLAAGAEGDMLSYLGIRYFGLAHAGRIYAFLFLFFSAGIVVGAPLFGAVFDRYGTYQPALRAGAAAWLLCGGLLLTLGAYPRFDREEDRR